MKKSKRNILIKREAIKLYLLGFWGIVITTLTVTMNLVGGQSDFRVMAGHTYTAQPGGVNGALTYSGTCSSDGSGVCYAKGTALVARGDACGADCTTGGTYWAPVTCSFTHKYNYAASGSATSYTGTGGPCTFGSTCYYYSGSATSYSGGSCNATSNCSTGTYYTGVSTCTWTNDTYSYTASGSVNRLTGSGPCNSSGTGYCFKLTQDASTTYDGSTGCGSGNCSGASLRYQLNSNCTWYTTSAVNNTATLTKAATDLSKTKYITFWVYSSNRTGSYMQFQMGEAASGEQTFPFTINSLSTWEQKTWDISGIATTSRDAITKLAFKSTDASTGFTFYFDDIQAIADVPADPSSCVIKESINDSSLVPSWIDNANNEDGYLLEKSTNGGGFGLLVSLGVNSTGYQDNLGVGTTGTYAYRARAFKAGIGGTDYSNYCTFPTLDLHKGDIQYNGVKINGLRSN